MEKLRNNFQKKVLKNGMTVLFEKRDLPVVSVAFAVRYGGVNESVEEKGIAHFIEHMLYKGTTSRTAKQISEEIEKNGGQLNGFTSEIATAYWCKIPSQKLGIALDVLGDLVRNPLFDAKELEKERKVIFEEIRMNRDNPMRHVFHEIGKTLYGKPFGDGVLGSFETLESIDQTKMREVFEKVYTPKNMILCVVGDAEFDEVVKYAEDNFEGEGGELFVEDIEKKNGDVVEKRKGLDQANLVFAYHIPVAGDEKNYAAQILNVLMADGLSSRLFQEIREKRNLAYAVKGDSDISKYFAYNVVYVGTTKENVELVKDLILKEFQEVSETLGEKELGEVKTQIIGNYHIEMEDSQVQMVELLFSEINGDVEEFYDFADKINSVKLEDVKDLAKTASEKFSFFSLVPEA